MTFENQCLYTLMTSSSFSYWVSTVCEEAIVEAPRKPALCQSSMFHVKLCGRQVNDSNVGLRNKGSELKKAALFAVNWYSEMLKISNKIKQK